MAASFLASHGIDLDALMSKIEIGQNQQDPQRDIETRTLPVSKILNARVPSESLNTRWDVTISSGIVTAVDPHEHSTMRLLNIPGVIDAQGALIAPALCHAHAHIDKAFLLSDSKFEDLTIENGDFNEAMSITGQAKARFEEDDLLRRGRRFIEESLAAGVSCMRVFVEVDEVVSLKSIDAVVQLKTQYEKMCNIQICAFAQLALFSGHELGDRRRELLLRALQNPRIDAVGSTPYVEDDQTKLKENVKWIIEQSIIFKKHIDFHLDYNVDSQHPASVWYVIEAIKSNQWQQKVGEGKTISLGHCTRLTLLSDEDFEQLRGEVTGLPVTFVGLPTSDIFMMSRPAKNERYKARRDRGTLQVLDMIEEHGLQAAIALNNVGNAFTPYGNCDPLQLASIGVGIYQAGTTQLAERLYETVSNRAASAIGLSLPTLRLRPGQDASLLFLGGAADDHETGCKSIALAVYSPPRKRMLLHRGQLVK